MNTVIISSQQVGEDDLRDFVLQAERLTGTKINLTAQWVLTCENPQIQDALGKMFAGAVSAEPKAPKRGRRKAGEDAVKKPFVLKPGKPREIKAWRLLDEDGNEVERLTVNELSSRLLLGKFLPGQRLRHPKLGVKYVVGASGSEQVVADEVEKPGGPLAATHSEERSD